MQSITVHAEWNGQTATFDLPASGHPAAAAASSGSVATGSHPSRPSMASLWHELRSVYPALAAPKESVACRLTYVDEDGEEVELETDSDLTDAATQAAARSPRLLEVFLRPPTHAHTNMLRSGLLDGEWESVQGDSNSPAVQSRSIAAAAPADVPAVAPAAAVVAAPLQPQEVEEKEEHKAEPAAASLEKPAPVALEATGQSSPPAAAASAPASAVSATSPPASSPSGFVGSLFSIFGRSAAAASPAAAGPDADIGPFAVTGPTLRLAGQPVRIR